MRSFKDRMRHMLMFEVIALIIVAVFGSWVTGHSVEKIGTLGLIFSGLAMTWNFSFNWMFDQWDRKYRGSKPRGVGLRIIHAILFEAVLMFVGIFIVAWWLNSTLWYALMLDISMSAFFLAYTFCFNWAYDVIFPLPLVETSSSHA